MKKVVMQKWVKALRSGNFKQDINHLKTEEGFCCLGVLCEISKIHYHGDLLSTEIMDWAGIHSEIGELPKKYKGKTGVLFNSLTALNDLGRLSFKQIANIIEKNYKDL